MSLVACDADANFNPRTAEQMHADAIVDGRVWINDGSETNRKNATLKTMILVEWIEVY